MPFNGSGSASAPGANYPAVANTLATAANRNGVDADIYTCLSTAICKDGQTTVTANIPFSNFKITGLGAGTARTDAASLATIQDGTGVYVGTVGGTVDVITLTPSPAITAYAAGQVFRFLASGVNTTNVTVNVSGLGAKALTKNGTTALVAGDLASGSMVTIAYDGTEFQLVGWRPTYLDNAVCDFRLTLTSGTPVTTSDVTAAGTLYCAPYKGNRIALYDGVNTWNIRKSAEFSLALTLTAGKPYDVFCYDNSGVPTLEVLVWTDDTTRATALTTQDGIYVKTGSTTRRYLGTIYSSGLNTTEDSYAKRYVWNYYNRVRRPMKVLEATNSWTYTTATIRQANASTANQLDCVIGASEDAVTAHVIANASNTNQGVGFQVFVGVDSTSAVASNCLTGVSSAPFANGFGTPFARWTGYPGAGRHTLTWLEYSTATGTTTWYGDNGGTILQSGISGEVMG